MKIEKIRFMKKLPQNRRTAIIGFCLLVLSGIITVSLLHFLGGVSTSTSIADFVGILAGATAWGLAFWYGIGVKRSTTSGTESEKK